MFSTGHLMWICICACVIAVGYIACRIRKPREDSLLRLCLALGVLSEAIKLFSVIRILPMVEVAVKGEALDYIYAGQYTPYLEMADLPFELCSLQIVFIAMMLFSKTPAWRSRLRALIYVTSVIGGLMGIVLAQVTVDYSAVREYFTSARIWQFFLYHSMVVILGLYMGFGPDSGVSLRSFKSTMGLLLMMDIPTFYLNSVFSQPVYRAGKPTGILYRVNFFSSYVNPLGLALTEKWQWLLYLLIRLALASALIALLLLAVSLRRRPAGNSSDSNTRV